MPFEPPSLKARWGPYYRASIEDTVAIVNAMQNVIGQTKNGGVQLAPRITAIEILAPFLGVDNPQALLEQIATEENDRAERELDAAKATLDAQASAKGSGPSAPGGPAKPPGDSGRTASGKDNASGKSRAASSPGSR